MTRTIKKFKHWDQTTLFNSLHKAGQIRLAIEENCYANQTNPGELPNSLVPTDILYNLCSCYEAMYDKLLKYELLEAGHPKTNLTTTH